MWGTASTSTSDFGHVAPAGEARRPDLNYRGTVRCVMNQYKAIDFPSGMLAKATAAKSFNKAFEENPGWDPVIFCDGPHMLGPVLVLKWSGD